MATIRLLPSTIYNSATSYLTIQNQNNALTNIDSTTYATITNTYSSTSNRYIYLRGFNFDDVPSNAVINSFIIKIKGYYTSGYSQSLSVCNGTSAISGPSATSFSTSVATREFSNSTLTWATMTGYGANFGIRVNCRRNSRNTQATYYIYGAEILVDYTLPVYHDVSVTNNSSGTVTPTGTTSVLEGDSYTLTISGVDNPTVTDNNTNVTSQLVQVTSGTSTLIPQSNTSSYITWTNIGNAYHDATNTTYASGAIAARATGTVYFDLSGAVIPTGATIQSVSCQATLQFNRNNSSSSFTSSCQMYAGTTAKGSAYQWVTSYTDASNKTTYTITAGTWTASEIANARFYITATNGASGTQRQIYVYGVSFIVTYTVSGTVYTYTISNVSSDHTIVVSSGGGTTQVIYRKVNGTWTALSPVAVYLKSNGSWVQKSTWSEAFDTTKKYQWNN